MKCKTKPIVHRVILHPRIVRSKWDNEEHYVNAGQLKRLYNVLPTDIVKVFDMRNRVCLQQQVEEGWVDLEVMYDGHYWDIHEWDDVKLMLERQIWGENKNGR